MFESARSVLELDEEQLGAMRGILNRVLGDETVTIWLDTYPRGLGFEAMLRRSRHLGLLLADEEEARQ